MKRNLAVSPLRCNFDLNVDVGRPTRSGHDCTRVNVDKSRNAVEVFHDISQAPSHKNNAEPGTLPQIIDGIEQADSIAKLFDDLSCFDVASRAMGCVKVW